jgi:hypothetical protein
MNDGQYFSQRSDCLEFSVEQAFESGFQPKIHAWLTDANTTQAQKEAFLQALLDFHDDDCGGFYQLRSFLLAAEYLALCPECRQGDAIVDRLLKLSYGYFRVEKADWCMPPEAFARSARETLARSDLGRVVPRLEAMIRQTESRAVMRHAARELLRIQPGNRCGIAAIGFDELTSRRYNTQSEPLRMRIVLSLAHTPIQSDDLAQGISQILVVNGGVDEEYNALQNFIQIFSPHPLVIYKMLLLTACVYDDEAYFYDERIRLQPKVDQLWQEIYQKDPTCIDILIQATASNHLTSKALGILCQLCPENEILASLLIKIWHRISRETAYPAWDGRRYFLDKMGEIGHYHPTVKLELLRIFYTSEETEIKYIAAINLKKIDPDQSEITQWIMSAIRQIMTSGFEPFLSQNLYIRYLWELYARSLAFEDIRPLAIEVWSQAVQHYHGHWSPGLIEALGFVPETIIHHCLEQLQTVIEKDGESYWTNSILSFLENFANHPQVILVIGNFIQTATEHESLFKAAKILLQSNVKHPSAIKVLKKVLTARTEHQGDRQGESDLFFQIVELLVKKNIHLKFVRRKLLHRASLPHSYFISQIWGIARYLSEIDQGNCTRLLTITKQFQAAKACAMNRPRTQAHDGDNYSLTGSLPIEPYLNWINHCPHAKLSNIVTSLKPELENESDDFHPIYHAIVWQCAQRLPHSTFHQAWQVNPRRS